MRTSSQRGLLVRNSVTASTTPLFISCFGCVISILIDIETYQKTGKMSEADELKKELFKMQDERKKIEDELILQRTVLESNKIGMKEKLVDEENFPRNDVDVYAVRLARNKIITLENDAKDLMNRMQSKLEQLHALTKPDNES